MGLVRAVSSEDPVNSIQPSELAGCVMRSSPHGMQVLTMVVADTLDSYQAATVDQFIVDYTNYVGACERIQRTPIPLPYTRHLSRYLSRPCQLPHGGDRSFISKNLATCTEY